MFTKLRPARTQMTGETEPEPKMKILCDFDALVSERVGFKFRNRQYVLGDVTVENYMQITKAYQTLLHTVTERSEGNLQSEDQVYQVYYDLVNPLVPDFSFSDLKQLSFPLLNQLMNLTLRQLAGDPSLYVKEEAQKKNP